MKSEVKVTGNRLQVTRVFDAPRSVVFANWKQAEKLQQWWGCKETAKVESSMDFRVGGSFTHKMHITGAGECLIVGQYDEIVEPEKISYHSDFGEMIMRVTVEFFEQGRQTRIVLTQEGLPDQNLVNIVSQGT